MTHLEAAVPERVYDYLVIGAGPAGLQLGQLLRSASRDFLILEAAGAPGAVFPTSPRHRKLISINKPHTGTTDPELNLRMDWNSLLSPDPELLFTRLSSRYFPSADDMVRYLADSARTLALRIEYETAVPAVSRAADGFEVTDSRGQTRLAR